MSENRALVLALIVMGALLIFMYSIDFAVGQEHKHRPEDAANHLKFYRTWNMPDNRAVSCCHDEDCQSAQAHMKNGKWYARQDGDDGEFIEIPPNKIEQDRDSPDGRSHLCGRKYTYMGAGSGFTVFCFLPAGGS